MPGYPECLVCPYRDDPGKTCHALASGVRRICELIELGRQWEALVVERTEADPSPPAPPPPAPASPSAATVMERQRLVLECDYRGPVAQCGCTPLRVCWLGRGSRPDPDAGYGHVVDRDCLECVTSPGEQPGMHHQA